MKKQTQWIFILILFLLIASKGRAQSHKLTKLDTCVGLKHNDWTTSDMTYLRLAASTKVGEVNGSQDTLTIFLPTTLKVIKIGDQYYDIVPHPTTIEPKKAPAHNTIFNLDSVQNRIYTYPYFEFTPNKAIYL
jgi:hypothetical protein